MGAAFQKAFGHSGMGGQGAGVQPDDWQPGSRDANTPKPKPYVPPPPPPVPHYIQPHFYANKQSQIQGATNNAFSTSHNYLHRFGTTSEHF